MGAPKKGKKTKDEDDIEDITVDTTFWVRFTKQHKDTKEQAKLMFNANCRTNILLDYIKRSCGYIDKDVVDLALPSGKCLLLHQNPETKASETITQRDEYILMAVEPNEDNPEEFIHIPLLEDDEELANVNWSGGESKKKKK